jgi:hypothetical protein
MASELMRDFRSVVFVSCVLMVFVFVGFYFSHD